MAHHYLKKEYADLPRAKELLGEHEALKTRAEDFVREERCKELAAKFKEWGTFLEQGQVKEATANLEAWCKANNQNNCPFDHLISGFIPTLFY